MTKAKGLFIDWKVIVVGLMVVLVGSNGYWMWRTGELMRVVRVIDGDTIVIKTGERVRLGGLDAPEEGMCGSEEAKDMLSELVMGKRIEILEDERDSWGRRLGTVKVGRLNVNLEMVKSGWVKYDSFSDKKSVEMEAAGRAAQEDMKGLFSISCDTISVCGILGNIDESTGKKYYHVPGCPTYPRVRIDEARGERKFCSEGEAKKAGFSLAPDCVK